MRFLTSSRAGDWSSGGAVRKSPPPLTIRPDPSPHVCKFLRPATCHNLPLMYDVENPPTKKKKKPTPLLDAVVRGEVLGLVLAGGDPVTIYRGASFIHSYPSLPHSFFHQPPSPDFGSMAHTPGQTPAPFLMLFHNAGASFAGALNCAGLPGQRSIVSCGIDFVQRRVDTRRSRQFRSHPSTENQPRLIRLPSLSAAFPTVSAMTAPPCPIGRGGPVVESLAV